MPITIKSASMKYKSPTTGNYVDVNAVSDTTTEIIAPDYSDITFPVAVGQHCIHEGSYYVANQTISSSETWTASHWTQVTVGGENQNLLSAITNGTIEENLLRSEMPGTSTTVTVDSNGNPISIVHTANSETVRTDSFVWGTGTVTETRTLANGKYITITTNLDTLAQTISAVQEVA